MSEGTRRIEGTRRTPNGSSKFWQGSFLLFPSVSLAFVLMANDRQLPFGIPLGALACVLATLGLLYCIGSFTPEPHLEYVSSRPELGRRCLELVITWIATLLALRSAVSGTLMGGTLGAAVLLPLLLGLSAFQLYRTACALGLFQNLVPTGTEAMPHKGSLWHHPSLFLLLITIAVYAPMLGQYSLIDPWETHYGEVAREILSRDDWMSLWWAQDGFFWSKPILDFWLQALSFSLLGVRHAPGAMLSAVASGAHPEPEWAARLPILLCSLLGQLLLYAGVARAWGKRAAWLGSLALVSVPYYTLIVHQSMTDLPYIAALMGAMGLFLLGYFTSDDAIVRGYKVCLGQTEAYLSGHALLLGLVVLFSVPQILYLFSRNLGLVTEGYHAGFYTHPDRFFVGSGGGNCGLPGNEACRLMDAVNSAPQPYVSALIWTTLLGLFLCRYRREFRKKRLYYLGAWLCVALSALAKGLPGPVLFIGTVLSFLVTTGQIRECRRLALPGACLIFCVVALPWFFQSTVRHGIDFLDRLFVHDMFKRAFEHVHDTNAGDDVSVRYYLWQLGYGLFPAVGVVTFGALGALGYRGRKGDKATEGFALLLIWFLVGFGMFTLTRTKYHHYIIPVVPALCLMVGPLLAAAIGYPCRLLRSGPWADLLRADSSREASLNFPLIGLSAAVVTCFAGLDLFGPSKAPGGAARLINLVTYNYARPWPEDIDLRPTLLGFTCISVVTLLGWLGPRPVRRISAGLFLVVALSFSAWLSNRYLPLVAPHWGQRETLSAYYRLRRGPEEPIVAYQMNWKGENFYTGNQIPTFITTGERFTQYLRTQRTSGGKVLFVTLEHTRIGNLKRELGQVQGVEVVTNKALNNKFALVRVTL